MKTQKILPYIAGILMTLIFGLSFLITKNALVFFTEISILTWRFSIAALAMSLLYFAGILKMQYRGKQWWQLLIIACIYPTLSFLLEAKGISLVPASQAGVIISLMPVIALVFSSFILKEHATVLQKFMVFLSVIGVIMITASSGESVGGGNSTGVFLLIGSAACCAMELILVRKISGVFSSIEVTFFMNVTGAIIFNIIACFRYWNSYYVTMLTPLLRVEGMFAIVYLGLLCSVVAFFCLNYITKQLSVARTSVFANFSTVVSVLAGVILGGEVLHVYQAMGILLILTGVWGINYFAVCRQEQV